MSIRRLLVAILLALGLTAALPAGGAARTLWLCRPGLPANACSSPLTVTRLSAQAERLGVTKVRRHPAVDCFYVYPTASDQPTVQAKRRIEPALRSIARYQAARYASECRLFAPLYRQITLAGIAAPSKISATMRERAYGDVRAAWRQYLRRYNHGRGVVLIGHSQGTLILRRLIAREIDRTPRLRRSLVSALLLGGDVTVARGKDVGGDFAHVPACRRPTQLHCVVAFSAFAASVPDDSLFGRATRPGLEVLCTNPAALGGGAAPLESVVPSLPFAPGTKLGSIPVLATPLPPVRTTFLSLAGSYSGRCVSDHGAEVLRVTAATGAPVLAPPPAPPWGLHLVEANLALGSLVRLVHGQATVYRTRDR